MQRVIYVVCITWFCLSYSKLLAQVTGRISGELLSKERQANGQFTLNAGQFYYDTQIKQLIYQIRFPVKETVVSQDTLVYRFQKGKLIQRIPSLAAPAASIFHMVLTGQLKNFGLKAPYYTIEKVEKEGDVVFVTYKPNKALSSFGQVKLAQRRNRLEGVVFLNDRGVVVAKQFFKNYTSVGPLEFPQEITIESVQNGKSYYQLTTYKNLVVNDFNDKSNYRYVLSK